MFSYTDAVWGEGRFGLVVLSEVVGVDAGTFNGAGAEVFDGEAFGGVGAVEGAALGMSLAFGGCCFCLSLPSLSFSLSLSFVLIAAVVLVDCRDVIIV